MTDVHIYRLPHQSATRYRVDMGDDRPLILRNPRRRLLPTTCCRRHRIAANLNVRAYYDMHVFTCKPGTGCRK